MEVKMDNTFVYNIVAKCIVPFNSLFYFLFNSPFNFPFDVSPLDFLNTLTSTFTF